MTEEKFLFTSEARKKLMILGAVGVVLALIGIAFAAMGGGHHEGAEAANHGSVWIKRIFSNLWINNVYFTGLALGL